jgi:hypothetical protein
MTTTAMTRNRTFSVLSILSIAILILVICTSAWLGCVYRVTTRNKDRLVSTLENPEEGFRHLRAPVLGFSLEQDPQRALYRVISHDNKRQVLHTGTLDECENVLVETLESTHGTGNVNWPLPTLGGKQFWGDQLVLRGWRVQENVYTGHFRLLDPDDTRHAWGTYEQCRVAFERVRVDNQLEPRSDHLVVLLHGLIRSKDSFAKLGRALESRGYEVATINYPSSQRSIREHSEQLATVLGATEGIRTVSFVTHSLGGIVVRDFLSCDLLEKKTALDVSRVVMLAPPNQGSIAAEILQDWFLYQTIAGESGQEITPEAVAKIPAPPCEFGVIAGGDGKSGYNPLLDGDDDGLVTVESTRLDGMKDFLIVPVSHTFIMDDDRVIEAVRSFLKYGSFTP